MNIKRLVSLGVAGLAIFFNGCVNPNFASASEDAAAKTSHAKIERGRLYIYRNSTLIAGELEFGTVVNSQIIAQVAAGTYAMLELKPGDYVASSTVPGNNQEFNIHITAGESCYLEQKYGWVTGGVCYEQVPRNVGIRSIQNLKMVKTRFKE